MIKHQLFQLCCDVGRFDLGVLDLLLDILFFVGQVFINLAVALDVGLLFKQIERGFNLLAQCLHVLIEAVEHQHTDVSGRCLETFDVFDEEQRLEQTNAKLVAQIALSLQDGALYGRLQRSANPLEHEVKGRQLPHRLGCYRYGNLAEDAQHRALAD